MLSGFDSDETLLPIEFADKRHIFMSNRDDVIRLGVRFLSANNDGVNADFGCSYCIPDIGSVEYHFSNLLFNSELTGFIGIREQEYRVPITTADPVTALKGCKPEQTENGSSER